MLRRKPKDTGLLDEVDLTLLAGVDAGLGFHALLQSTSCSAEEAQLRVLRLMHTGHLEDIANDGAPAAAVREAPETIRPRTPSSANEPSLQGKTVPPSARAARDALLRELSIRRSGTSYPPVSVSEPPPPLNSLSPGHYSVRPNRAASEPSEREPVSVSITSNAPGRYSLRDEPSAATSSAPPARRDSGFDSPLAALIHEFSSGQDRERWCAARLRTALHEELSGNVQGAINVLEAVLLQVSDPRIRGERDRLQSRSLKATSGVYRSQALIAERADKHKEAAASWRKVLEAFPDDAEATLHAAKCSMESGDLKQAGVHARRAVELAPDSVAAHKLLLRFFRKTGMEHSANREREIVRRLAKG